MNIKPLSLILSHLKIGIVGFGGGAALTPVFEDELVENKKWISREAFNKVIVAASVCPASMNIAICSIWNSRYSVLNSYAFALPGPLLFLAVLTGFSYAGDTIKRYIEFASAGFIAFVVFLIFLFIQKRDSQRAGTLKRSHSFIILTASFLLTCESAVKQILTFIAPVIGKAMPATLFAINAISLILSAIFVIVFVGKSRSWLKLGAALIVAGAYAISAGKMGILKKWSAPLLVFMGILAVSSIAYDTLRYKAASESGVNSENNVNGVYNARNANSANNVNGATSAGHAGRASLKPLRNIAVFILISLVFVSAAYYMTRDLSIFEFAGKALLSALTSFGGGKAYIAVADSVFVQSGFISTETFYNQVIGISNAMPGSTLLTIVTGVGYAYGFGHGGVAIGWLFALLGMSLGVTATAFAAIIIFTYFQVFAESQRLKMIVEYMMPVVCGLLITTILTLVYQSALIVNSVGVPPAVSVGVIAVLSLLITLVNRYAKVDRALLMLASGFGTLLALGLMSL